jgi:hypothetical protein
MALYADVELVLAAARALRFVREEPKSSNRGQGVEAIQRSTGNGPGDPWCASYVTYCGVAAIGQAWPLPASGSCASLGRYAEEHGLLVTGPPERGDVFLLWYPKLDRFAHTGFCTDSTGTTLEGNTGQKGEREGWGVFERTRTFGENDRFIRWRSLEGPQADL